MNNGERNEFLIKFKLIDLRDTGNFSFNGSNITSVGFNGTEYSSLPSSFNIKSLNSMQDSDIIQLAKAIGVSKSPARAKSDVSINGRGYSVKFMKKANPAIVNHTNRKGFSNVALLLNINIYNLDHLISNYWSLRQRGIISEDILNNNLNSPFNLIRLF